MNPGPAPTLLSEWFTPTGFGIIVAILLVVAVIVVIAESLRVRRENDAQDVPEPAPPAYDDTCFIEVCHRPGLVPTHTIHGIRFVCRRHSGQVGDWVGHDAVYDQDLDPATDLSRWDKEMDAS